MQASDVIQVQQGQHLGQLREFSTAILKYAHTAAANLVTALELKCMFACICTIMYSSWKLLHTAWLLVGRSHIEAG